MNMLNAFIVQRPLMVNMYWNCKSCICLTVTGYKVDQCDTSFLLQISNKVLTHQLNIFDIYCNIWTSYNTKGGLLAQGAEEAFKTGIDQVKLVNLV